MVQTSSCNQACTLAGTMEPFKCGVSWNMSVYYFRNGVTVYKEDTHHLQRLCVQQCSWFESSPLYCLFCTALHQIFPLNQIHCLFIQMYYNGESGDSCKCFYVSLNLTLEAQDFLILFFFYSIRRQAKIQITTNFRTLPWPHQTPHKS